MVGENNQETPRRFLVRLLRFSFVSSDFVSLSFAEAIVAELHKKIKEAFEVFDHESNNTVDVRFGNIHCYGSKL